MMHSHAFTVGTLPFVVFQLAVSIDAQQPPDPLIAAVQLSYTATLSESALGEPAEGWTVSLKEIALSTSDITLRRRLEQNNAKPRYFATLSLDCPLEEHRPIGRGWAAINAESSARTGFTVDEILLVRLAHTLDVGIGDVCVLLLAPCISWCTYSAGGNIKTTSTECKSAMRGTYIEPTGIQVDPASGAATTTATLGTPRDSGYVTNMDIKSGTELSDYLGSFLVDLTSFLS